MQCVRSLFLLMILAVSHPLLAAECQDVFPDPAASYAANGTIEFLYQARLIGSDGELTFNNVYDYSNGNVSCDTQSCVSGPSNSANLTLPTFQTSNTVADVQVNAYTTVNLSQGEYDDVFIEQGGQLNLTTVDGNYVIDHLHVKVGSIVQLSGGTYWINTLTLEQDAQLIINGAEPATIFVQTAHFKYNAKVNSLGTPEQLVLISYDSVTMEQGTRVNGFGYASNSMHLKYQSQWLGAVNTAYLRMESEARITYAPNAIEQADFANTCSVGVTLPQPIGHWPIDVCSLSGNRYELIDVAGGNHGSTYNNSGVDYNGKYCQAGRIRGSGNVMSIPHSDAYHLPNGTVSLWINVPKLSHRSRPSAGGMGIFSKDSNGRDNGGHLTFWVTRYGAVRVRMENTTTSATIQTGNYIRENQWHHIVVTFGSDGLRTYIDGTLRGTQTNFTSGLGYNREPIILGANAWQTGNDSSPNNQLRDIYRGSIDDVRIYEQQLNAQEVSTLTNLAGGACASCNSNPELKAHWPLDLCAVNGSNGEIVDIVGSTPGSAIGNATAINDGKFCQAGKLNGAGAHINIPHTSAMSLGSGSISLWLNTPDLAYTEQSHIGGMGLFSRDSTDYDNGGHLTAWLTSDGRVNVRHQSTSQSYFVSSPAGAIRTNTWQHVVYSFGAQGMRLYIDGELVATNNQFSGGISGNSEPLILGATATISGDNQALPSQLRDFYKGGFDDVRLYENALGAADVDALYRESGYACENCTGDYPVALYRFEEEDYTGPGQVYDASGNSFHGDPIGNVQPILPAMPISCRALDVPQNFNNTVDALNTKIDMNQVGGRGTISFWYRSSLPWIDGNARQLFDASRIANPPDRDLLTDKFFFFVLKHDGSMRLAMEDSDDLDLIVDTYRYRVPANQWVHFAISWDLVNRTASLHLNGYEQPIFITAQVETSQLGDLGNLHVGDNGTEYVIIQGTDNSAYGQFDDVRVYNFIQTRAQIVADIQDRIECSPIDHYRIIHSEQALTCASTEVTIQACANANCSQLVTEPTELTLSPSGWQGGDSVTFTGSITKNLSHATAERVTLGLSNANPAAPVVCDPDCTIDFVDAGFEFFNVNQFGNSDLPAVIAESDLGVIGIRAIENRNGECSALLSGTHTVNFGYDCVTTADALYSTNQCRVPFAGIPLSGGGTGVNSGTMNLTFDADGEARLSGKQYADAGRLNLSVSANIDGANITSGNTPFDSIPDQLQISSTASDPQVAGEPFSLTFAALGANGSLLPSYQPSQFQLDVQRTSPVNSVIDGGLHYAPGATLNSQVGLVNFANAAPLTFNSGQYQYAQAYFEEVGSITLDIRDANYLGEMINANEFAMGRFIPAYFDVSTLNAGQFADSCSSAFTYVGQPFTYSLGNEPGIQIVARNALGDITSNYADTLWRLSPDMGSVSFADASTYAGEASVEQLGSVSLSGTDQFDGSARLELLASQFAYIKTATPTVPFESVIDITLEAGFLTDSDGVCYQSAYPAGCQSYALGNIQGTTQRYGRLVIGNTHGPEEEQLAMPVATEFFVDDGWRINTQDSCTAINFSQTAGDIVVTNASSGDQEHDIVGLLAPVSSTGLMAQGMSGDDDFLLGPALDANGNALRGSILMTLDPTTGKDWTDFLNVDWNQDGVIDDNDSPNGFATFGIPRDNDRTIHWRESFE
ncbi:LamG domain-containing protein [Alteromonas facilis]|uniref:LamG domain-containing protein n=1 Tax=Alteromonas facilis TaxID=2048004 RepID=UPI000C288D08|nr:LamG domain-containing protein [Alteromonas facilis]